MRLLPYSLLILIAIAACRGSSSPSLLPPQDETDEPIGDIWVYQSPVLAVDNIGDRTQTTNTCQDTYDNNAATWGITCTKFVALLGYSSDNGVQKLPSSYGVPRNSPFYLIDGDEIAPDWDSFIAQQNIKLSGTGFVSGYRISYAGFDNGGVLKDNCQDWSNFSVAQMAATTDREIPGDWSYSASSCNTITPRPFLCLCWQPEF